MFGGLGFRESGLQIVDVAFFQRLDEVEASVSCLSYRLVTLFSRQCWVAFKMF